MKVNVLKSLQLIALSSLALGLSLPAMAQSAQQTSQLPTIAAYETPELVDAPLPQRADPAQLPAAGESSSLSFAADPVAVGGFWPFSHDAGDRPEPTAKAPTPKLFWIATGLLMASSAANAETLARCDNCTFLPYSLHRRGVTYGAGLSLDIAVTLLTRHYAHKGRLWWLVPDALLTAGNGFLAYHWASSTN